MGIQIFLTTIAILRVFLEIKGVDLSSFPVSRALARAKTKNKGNVEFERRAREHEESMRKFHRMGLYFSLGYLLFVAPSIFFQ